MNIIVPYRNRQEHLDMFLPCILRYLPGCSVVIVEQADDKPFNRGKLINVGYLETNPEYFVAHDVDMLPVNVDYSERRGITQLAKSYIQLHNYLGGATMYQGAAFRSLGGYHNDFWSRAEDNEMYFNIIRSHQYRIVHRPGVYTTLPHPRTGPEFIPELWIKAQLQRQIQDQLSVCSYSVKKSVQLEGYTLLQVSI